MTISRCDFAKPMLRDVFATWDDWHGELQTVTGYSWEEYLALFVRICGDDYSLEGGEEEMLQQAANQFRGYPGIVTANLESVFGERWATHLDETFPSMRA